MFTSYQLVEKRDEGMQVIFDGDVEGVSIFEVDWDCCDH